ncbi:MAG: hypothetical protein Q9174_001798 [Haloplaca sp. 1 TL-2023]
MARRMRPSRTTSLPIRQRGRKSVYREASTDASSDPEVPEVHETRPRRKRRRISYNESSSESDYGFQTIDESRVPSTTRSKEPQAHQKWASSKSRKTARPQPAIVVRKDERSTAQPRRRKKTESNTKKDPGHSGNLSMDNTSGRIPPWSTLPYEILLQIFQYASYPLHNPAGAPTPSVPWLFRVAILCRGFFEPAMSALYYTPVLWPKSRTDKLLATLAKQDDTSFMNYRTKVKYVDFEGLQIVSRKSAGPEPIQIGDLLALTPQVRGFGIHFLYDIPSLHKKTAVSDLPSGKRRAYQASLLSKLNDTDNSIRLLDWTWNGVMGLPSDKSPQDFLKDNPMTALQFVKSLTFVNPMKQSHELDWFKHLLGVSKNLTTVNLRNFDDVAERLEFLPSDLTSLEISMCTEFDSSLFAEVLAAKGANLRTLVLNHNDCLDMSFLTVLAATSPHLEELKMDLRFYNTHFTYRDSDPKFHALLDPKDIPAWPSTLQRLELYHLRKWETTAAETFFSSLTDSAKNLPDLRHIDIKASIGESNWRDRISFRNKWTAKMQKVFARIADPPDPRLRSLKIFEKHRKEYRKAKSKANGPSGHDPKGITGHTATIPTPETSKTVSEDSDAPLASRLRHPKPTNPPQVITRRRSRKTRKHKHSPDSSSSSEEDSALDDDDPPLDNPSPADSPIEAEGEVFVQGMCDVVRVAIDNLRPTEEHLDERDFLDEEVSGDEDYEN